MVAEASAPQPPPPLLQILTVLSADPVTAEPSPKNLAHVTFLSWPARVPATWPLAWSKRTAVLSAPPVRVTKGLDGCRSTQSRAGDFDECGDADDFSVYVLTSWAEASVAGIARFLRPLESSFPLAAMADSTALVMPAAAAAADGSKSMPSAPTAPTPEPAACPVATTWAWKSATWDCRAPSMARASSRSRESRAITRHAASCWYSTWLSSFRVASRCCLRV
mmetsp:Transcript_50548/g.114821  ORF Transcript_50548/g.114821 Transcript_50548/m.114821 type:complete len:222 (+) Transcript_50548:651-1316(+)